MTTAAATDAELVVRAQQGDLDAFGVLYERHFNLVHDYVSRLAKDYALAADVTRETFVTAMQQVGQLDDPERFRSWLYGVARTLAIDQIEQERELATSTGSLGNHAQARLDIVIDLGSIPDRREAGQIKEVAELVWDAAASLDEPAFTVLDLTARRRLTSSEIGDVTRVDADDGGASVDMLLDEASDRITTYLMMRRGTDQCEELRDIVGDQTTPPEPALRTEVRKHIGSCAACAATRRALVSPPQVMAAMQTIAAPEIVYTKTWEDIVDRWREAASRPRGRRRRLVAALVLGLAFTAFAALGVFGSVALNDSQPEAGDIGAQPPGGPSTDQGGSEPALLPAPTSTTMGAVTSTSVPTSQPAGAPPPHQSAPASTTTTSNPAAATTTTTIVSATTTTAPLTTTTAAPTTTTVAPTTTLLPNQAPTVTIIAPAGGTHYQSQAPLEITLVATVSDDRDNGLVADWFEGSTPLGSGNTITYTFTFGCPDAVTHTVTAAATDSSGLTASDTVTFTVGCKPTP